jgi:4-amino-4-deoxy-L-arabinose transferase-like glycosyltransferase
MRGARLTSCFARRNAVIILRTVMDQRETVSSKQSRAVWLLLCCIVVLRLAAAFFIPFGQKVEHRLEGLNDEPAHFNYVKYLAQHRAFPVLEHNVMEPDAFVRSEFEYHQAPLYYLVCAPLYGMLGGKGALAACRLLSVLCGLAGLWVIALILRDCGLPAHVPLAAALFVGLLPSHLYFTVLASNDALSWLFALLLTRALLRYGTLGEENPGAVRTAIMTAVYLAAGALTKGSLLVFFPAAACVFIYKYFISKNRSHLVRGAWALGISAAAVLPWYVRNLLLYHSLIGTPSASGEAFFTLQGLYGFLKMTDKHFWFPMQHLQGGTAAYAVLCAVGGAVIAFQAFLALLYIVKD